MFEVIIENVSGLKLLDNMIWGEADCFIQYHFPAQMASAGRIGGATVVCGMLLLSLLQMIIVYNNSIAPIISVFRCCGAQVRPHISVHFLNGWTKVDDC